MAIWFALANHHQTIQPMVSGVVDVSDPNHPRETYYGSPQDKTLDQMLFNLNLTVYKEDKISVLPSPLLGLGSRIQIQRALPVEVTDAKKVTVYHTWSKTVSDLLAEQNISLVDKDSVEPALETSLSPDLKIKITRVEEAQLTQEETIPYKTIKKNDPNMDKGKTRVEQEGKNGTRIITYLIRREDGTEISRKILSNKVTQEPQNKIVYVGTRVVVLGRGKATWYALISGMTAAHNTLPRYSYVRVTAVNSGRSIVVKIIDRGIYSDAIIDLSADAFSLLAPLGAGVIDVVLTVP